MDGQDKGSTGGNYCSYSIVISPLNYCNPSSKVKIGEYFYLIKLCLLYKPLLERFSYDLKRNNKRTENERFDWFIEQIQMHVAFGWLRKCSDEKSSCQRTF